MPSSHPNIDTFRKTGATPFAAAKGVRKFYPFSFRRTNKGIQVQVHWTRLVISSCLFLILGWLGLASGAYFFVKYQRGFGDVQFSDMLVLPVRWHAYQVSRGNFFIKSAQGELKAGNYREAFYALRIGVNKAPSSKEGRILLAQFYGAWKRPDLAQQTLLEGLPFHPDDQEYLRLLFSFLLQRQEDARTLSLANALIGKDRTPSPRNQIVALAAASASFYRGNYDQAEDYIHMFGLKYTRDGRLLAARIAWERGFKDQALTQLRELASESPKDEEIYAQCVSYLRETGRDDEARRESFLRSISNPNDARARIDLLYALQKQGDTDAVLSNANDIFNDFSNNSNALLALADFAANTGNSPLAQRVYDFSTLNKLNWEGAALMMVEANIVAKKYQSALDLVNQLLVENPDWGKRYYAVFNGLQAIAHYGLGDPESAQLFLNNFLTQSNVRAENLLAVSKRLIEVGAQTQARQVLVEAVKADPLNQAALTSLIKIDLPLNNTDTLVANIRKLLALRKPPRELLSSAYRKLGSDLFLFSPGRLVLLEDLRTAISASQTNS